MDITIKKIINYFTKKTKTLFLVDGLGAALTTFYLYFVLKHFYEYFGMPTYILTYLSFIGLVFCVYSMTCFFLLKGNWSPFLRLISIGNLIYCVLTMILVYIYFKDLTKLGLIYFLLEITIIVLIVYIELHVATALKNNKQNNVA